METSRAKELIRKYRDGTLTETEKALLESWYLDLGKQSSVSMDGAELEQHLDDVWAALPLSQQNNEAVHTRPLYRWMAIAASVILSLSVGAYWFYQQKTKTIAQPVATATDALPGDNKAVLTLASGAEILLDKMGNGELAREGNTAIVKTKAGEVVYQSSGAGDQNAEMLNYNTIVTPKAGQYQVTLPDGTKAWLNAASSLRFPTKFPAHERVIEIMGEVYLEVAKVRIGRRNVPFKVLAGKQLVEVLGTRFNINSYKDEGDITTTLVEGSIKVNATGSEQKGILLRPGQQSRLLSNSRRAATAFDVKEVNTQSVIAWKDGFFKFDNVGLPELMRQLSRWYDMEVVYSGPVREHEFVGQIERSTRLSKVLKILEMGDVHFRIEGKKIIVTD